ncbi:MAG: regulatory protein RecX [Deltaproteobacteria bacterium]|nr:regulatory protein RecX [Deltaproteobacteria bacterium]
MDGDRELGRAEGKAFRLLTLRAHSEKELRVKLQAGGFSTAVVEEVLRRCRELGYLNDEAFARQRARLLAISRLAGDRRIALDLREKGIDAGLSARVIAEVRGELGEEEAAGRLLRKKIRGRPVAALNDREKARLARGLMGRGFPTGLILKVLKKTEEEGFHGDDGE